MDAKRDLLRHTVATLAYRGGKTLRGATDGFDVFRASESSRTPAQILAHIGDLLDWALSLAKGDESWHTSAPLAWDDEVARFYAGLASFDAYLSSDQPVQAPAEQLFQGPIADALTHVGQIGMLRRMAGCPMRGENYYVAHIAAGRIGAIQEAPRYEFD